MAPQFDFKKSLQELEESLGLSEGFIERLEEEDDWSFVIKAHALVEAAVTQLLVHELGKPQLGDVVARLDMTAPFGKLAFAENLGLIDKRTKRFIRTLGEIRNDFAHRVSNAGMALGSYLSGLGEDKSKAIHEGLDLILPKGESIPTDEGAKTPHQFFCFRPKLLIASSLGLVLFQIHVQTSVAKGAQKMRESADEVFRAFFMYAAREGTAGVPGTLGGIISPERDPSADPELRSAVTNPEKASEK